MDAKATGASIEAVTGELKKRNPELAEDYLSGDPEREMRAVEAIIKSDLFYAFIDRETIERELESSGQDHIALTMKQLGQIRNNYALPPAFVAKFREAPDKYNGKQKVILDGTHRALVSAIVKRRQYVIEVDMDQIVK